MRPQQEQRDLESVWDWDTPDKLLADLDKWREEHSEVQERIVSKDGERVAAIVKGEDDPLPYVLTRHLVERLREDLVSSIQPERPPLLHRHER